MANNLQIAVDAVNKAKNTLRGVQDDLRGVGEAAGDAADGTGRSVSSLNDLSGASEQAASSSGRLRGALGDVAKIAGGFVIAQGLMQVPSLIGGTIGAASDLNETISKSNTIFGENASQIEKWASGAAKSFGQSKQQALESAASFGNMFQQLGIGGDMAVDMSTSITELASDFASFHNADITQVLEAQSAAFRGEYDSIQRFIPTINAAAVEQKALEMSGKASTDALTEQDKALAVHTFMMENAGAAVGDFDRTSDGLANRQRILSARFADMRAKVGNLLIPVMDALTGVVLDKVIPAFEFVGRTVSGFIDSVRWLIENGGGLADIVPGDEAPTFFQRLAVFVAEAVVWIRDEFIPAVVGFVQEVGPILLRVLGQVAEAFARILPLVAEVVTMLVERGREMIATLGPVLADIVGGFMNLGSALGGLPGIISALISPLDGMANAVDRSLGWIVSNEAVLIGTLTTLGVVLAATVVPGIVATTTALYAKAAAWVAVQIAAAPSTALLLGIAVAVGALVAGIVYLVRNWDDLKTRFPILQELEAVARRAFESISSFITGTLIPAIQDFARWIGPALMEAAIVIVGFIMSDVVPAVQALAGFIMSDVVPALQTLAGWIANEVLPAFAPLVAYIRDDVMPAVQAFAGFLRENIPPAIAAVTGFITGTLLPTIATMVEIFRVDVMPILEMVGETFVRIFQRVILPMIEGWFDALGIIMQGVIDYIRGVTDFLVGVFTGDWERAWDGIRQIVDAIITTIKGLVENAIRTMIDVVVGLMNVFGVDIETIFSTIRDTVGSIIDATRDWIVETVTDAKDTAVSVFSEGRDLITGVWDSLYGNVSERVSSLRDNIVNTITEAKDLAVGIFTDLRDTASSLIEEAKGLITGSIEGLRDRISTLATEIKEGFLEGFRGIRDTIDNILVAVKAAIATPINAVINGLNIFLGGLVSGVNWIARNLGLENPLHWDNIPQFAKGVRNFKGGPAIVGEKGPELTWLAPGSNVMPADQTSALLKALSSGTAIGGFPGSGIVDSIVDIPSNTLDALGDLPGDIASGIRDLMAKGAGALVDAALDAVGLVVPSLPPLLSGFGGGIFSMLKDALIDVVAGWIKGVEDALPKATGIWGRPLPYYTVTQEYGRTDFSGVYASGAHSGIDLAASEGTPIFAADGGTVSSAGWNGGYGNAVSIQHDEVLSSLYGHMSSIATSLNRIVTKGETIGFVGSTGFSTGPHLHFEARRNGMTFNPRDMVALAKGGIVTRPTVALMGEAGPEAVIPLSRYGIGGPGDQFGVNIARTQEAIASLDFNETQIAAEGIRWIDALQQGTDRRWASFVEWVNGLPEDIRLSLGTHLGRLAPELADQGYTLMENLRVGFMLGGEDVYDELMAVYGRVNVGIKTALAHNLATMTEEGRNLATQGALWVRDLETGVQTNWWEFIQWLNVQPDEVRTAMLPKLLTISDELGAMGYSLFENMMIGVNVQLDRMKTDSQVSIGEMHTHTVGGLSAMGVAMDETVVSGYTKVGDSIDTHGAINTAKAVANQQDVLDIIQTTNEEIANMPGGCDVPRVPVPSTPSRPNPPYSRSPLKPDFQTGHIWRGSDPPWVDYGGWIPREDGTWIFQTSGPFHPPVKVTVRNPAGPHTGGGVSKTPELIPPASGYSPTLIPPASGYSYRPIPVAGGAGGPNVVSGTQGSQTPDPFMEVISPELASLMRVDPSLRHAYAAMDPEAQRAANYWAQRALKTVTGWPPSPGPAFVTAAKAWWQGHSAVGPTPTKMEIGGIVTGPVRAIVGEGAHDEAVIPLNARGLAFMRQAVTGAGAGGGTTVTITINVDARGADESSINRFRQVIREEVPALIDRYNEQQWGPDAAAHGVTVEVG